MKKPLTLCILATLVSLPVWADEDEFEILEQDVIKLAAGKAKITMKQAIEAAKNEAGGGKFAAAKLGVQGVTPIFEVLFLTDKDATDVTIDAISGKVLGKKTDQSDADEYSQTREASNESKFGLVLAIDAALSEVKGGAVVEAEADFADGKLGFEIEVLQGDRFVQVHMDASGKVLKTEVETVEGQAWIFDREDAGKSPAGWKFGYTNPADGKANWTLSKDDKAPTGPNVLTLDAKSGGSVFNLAMAEKSSYRDVDVRTRLRADSGKEDQGGGLIWRCMDEKNYYVCRINPLESNFRVYKVLNGKRQQLQSADVNLETGKWHVVRARMVGNHILCFVDGKKLLDVTDDEIKDAGMIGLWTKADASSSFDNVAVQPGKLSKQDQEAAKPAVPGRLADEEEDDDE